MSKQCIKKGKVENYVKIGQKEALQIYEKALK